MRSLAVGVKAAFPARYEAHYHPAIAAAYLLDPIYWEKVGAQDLPRPPSECVEEQREDIIKLIARLSGGGQGVREWDVAFLTSCGIDRRPRQT